VAPLDLLDVEGPIELPGEQPGVASTNRAASANVNASGAAKSFLPKRSLSTGMSVK
jgi:hypothetical protein